MFRRACHASLALTAAACHLHPSNNDGGAINIAANADTVFVARGCNGIEVVDAATGAVLSSIEPSGDSDSYDDLSHAEGLLFALDADDGYLSTFSIETDRSLRLLVGDESVEVGAYSGVAAAASLVAVSGGTSEISFYTYGPDGSLTRAGTLKGHRGHPDVALDPSGRLALISTHFSEEVDGHEFGLVSASLGQLAFIDTEAVPGAGFTEGGGTPASFPLRVAFVSDNALVAHGGGLSVLRIDADLGIEHVTTLDLDLEAVDVVVDGSSAYVVGASPRPQLIELDITDVAAPALTRTFDVAGECAAPTAVAVVGPRVFVAAGEAGLQVIDR
jgi:hypothetical protein